MVVLCHNQKDMARLETLESKNGLPVCPLALAWGRWKTEKPCIEPPLLAYLEFSLPPSKCTVKSLVSARVGWRSEADRATTCWLDSSSYLLHDVPSLVHGSQAAENQLRGLSFSRTTLPTGRTQGQRVSFSRPLHTHSNP